MSNTDPVTAEEIARLSRVFNILASTDETIEIEVSTLQKLLAEREQMLTYDRAVALVEREPELPGDMPLRLRDVSRQDLARAAVRMTKRGIVARLRRTQPGKAEG